MQVSWVMTSTHLGQYIDLDASTYNTQEIGAYKHKINKVVLFFNKPIIIICFIHLLQHNCISTRWTCHGWLATLQSLWSIALLGKLNTPSMVLLAHFTCKHVPANNACNGSFYDHWFHSACLHASYNAHGHAWLCSDCPRLHCMAAWCLLGMSRTCMHPEAWLVQVVACHWGDMQDVCIAVRVMHTCNASSCIICLHASSLQLTLACMTTWMQDNVGCTQSVHAQYNNVLHVVLQLLYRCNVSWCAL